MFLKAQKGNNQFWRYLVTLSVVMIVWRVIGGIPLEAFIEYNSLLVSEIIALNDILLHFRFSRNTIFFLLLLPTVLSFGVLLWMIKALHGRTFTDTTTGSTQFRWERFFKGFFLWTVFSALILGARVLMMPNSIYWSFQPAAFAGLLVLSLLLLPIQTGFEEFFFRGYLLQGLQLLTKNKWLAVLLTSLVFALFHILNPEVKAFGMTLAMPFYLMFGLLFGVITVLDNGLELAWGVHAGHNIFLCLFINHQDSAFQTPAMLRSMEVNPTMNLVFFTIACTIFFGVCWKWFGWPFTEPPIIAATESLDG